MYFGNPRKTIVKYSIFINDSSRKNREAVKPRKEDREEFLKQREKVRQRRSSIQLENENGEGELKQVIKNTGKERKKTARSKGEEKG